tara:strand:+ start:4245 stop:5261 length:1017 start_codon:yes stop_codon:yes gene_type:complete
MSFFNTLTKNKIYVIAEACDNHMGSFDMAIALVDAAIDAGADAVKFQHHLAYEEMLEESPMSDNFEEPLFDFLQRNSLNLEQHYKLKEYCDSKKITYLCTPFSFKAAEEIQSLVPFFKIGSGEFQDHWFIDNLKTIGKPVLFSTGMCSWDELKSNVEYIKKTNLDFALMNCLSEYPPKYADMNLNLIEKMIEEYPNIIIGHSDHSPEIYTTIVSAFLGARILEKHITISSFVPGPDQSVSIESDEFKKLISAVQYIDKTSGFEKKIQDKEVDIRTWAYRSIVAKRDINPGEIISSNDIQTKRPGLGIPSNQYKKVIGKKALNLIKENTLISWKDLDEE